MIRKQQLPHKDKVKVIFEIPDTFGVNRSTCSKILTTGIPKANLFGITVKKIGKSSDRR